MKKPVQYLSIVIVFVLSGFYARPQAPSISYSPSTVAFSLGVAITNMTPSNGGGTITTGSYSPVYSFYSVNAPYDVTVDASGNIYTMSESSGTLYKLSPTGTSTTLYTGLNAPVGVAIDALGNIYVSDWGDNSVYKFDTSGNLLATITGFNQPYGIAFDSSNNAYVANLGTGAIIKITAGTTSTSSYATGLTNPYGVALDPSGNVYVSQYTQNNIIKITTGGTQSVFASGFNGPRQLGADGSGNIYVADYGNNAIKMVTPGGTVSTVISSGLSSPRSVQVDASGSMYIADYGNNAIKKRAVTGYIINTALPSGLSFNTSTGVISGTPTTTFSSTTYTIIGYNTSGKSSTTVKLSCTQSTVNWTAAANSTSWENGSNWSTGSVPGQYDAVQIGVVNYSKNKQPTLSSNRTVYSITFGSAKQAKLTVSSGDALTVSNNITVNMGATPTIKGSGTAAVNMSPGSIINVNGTGTLTLTSPLSFTLESDATGDASIGQLSGTNIIKGTAASSITVQRYLNGGSSSYRGYRLLSSPVYNGTDTHSNNVYSINYLINSMYLTATTTTGGFDNTAAANPSLYLYRENLTNPNFTTFTGSNYRGINAINNTPSYMYTLDIDGSGYYIPSGNGYLCFFRGDRSATTFANETQVSYVPQPTTLSTSGTLNAGQITAVDWFTPTSSNLSYTSASPVAGYNLVGNPYASAIDWDTFQTSSTTTGIYGSNVTSTMYVLDPVTKNYGSYISGSGGIGSATFVSNIISSGQGFFVVATSASAKLIFNESAKTTSQNTGTNLLMGQPVKTVADPYMRLQLSQTSTISDQTLVRFNNQASLAYSSNLDAPYKSGYGAVSLATLSSDKISLSINTIPLPKLQSETINLNVSANSDGIYSLSLQNIVSVPRLYDIWLIDHYKNDSLDMRQNGAYNFNIYRNDTLSFGSKRFSLVIRQNPAYAYRLISFAASKAEGYEQTQVTWQTANEENYTYFTVERSTDHGKTFDVVGSATATGAGSYSLLDKSPLMGLNMYRLKQVDINGTVTYSNVVSIEYSNQSDKVYFDNLSIYPNPAKNVINLSVETKSTDNTSYSIMFLNSSGLIVQQATSSQPTWQGNVNNLQPGTYVVSVIDNKTKSLVGKAKFVKL